MRIRSTPPHRPRAAAAPRVNHFSTNPKGKRAARRGARRLPVPRPRPDGLRLSLPLSLILAPERAGLQGTQPDGLRWQPYRSVTGYGQARDGKGGKGALRAAGGLSPPLPCDRGLPSLTGLRRFAHRATALARRRPVRAPRQAGPRRGAGGPLVGTRRGEGACPACPTAHQSVPACGQGPVGAHRSPRAGARRTSGVPI